MRVFCLIVSGFFFYMVSLLSLVNEGPGTTKAIIVAIFSIPAFLFLIPGVDPRGGAYVRRNIGIVLLSATAVSLLVIVQFALMVRDPATAKYIRPDTLQFFGDYKSGAICLAIYTVAGLVLLRTSR
jgi:hypothetical protein